MMKSSLVIAIFCIGFVLFNIIMFLSKGNNISLIMAIIWLGIGLKNFNHFRNTKKE